MTLPSSAVMSSGRVMVLVPLAKTRTDSTAWLGVAASTGTVDRNAGIPTNSAAPAAGNHRLRAFVLMVPVLLVRSPGPTSVNRAIGVDASWRRSAFYTLLVAVLRSNHDCSGRRLTLSKGRRRQLVMLGVRWPRLPRERATCALGVRTSCARWTARLMAPP
jgi:hypothetical protein